MKNILILGNKGKESVLRAIEEIEPWLATLADVQVDLDAEANADVEDADAAVVLGGDGSVLQAARKLGERQVPLLGVNVGKFGFLTETTLEDVKAALIDVLEDRFDTVERMLIQCALERNGEEVLNTVGLNDAVVSRTALSRLITLDLEVDDELVATCRADGLIVATPVGSTAHNLASGGPIVSPDMEALVVTSICPHTLSMRPLVLPASSVIAVRIVQFPERPSLTVDGQVSRPLEEQDCVRVWKSEATLKLIKTGKHTFFETLRNKLDWRGQPRHV